MNGRISLSTSRQPLMILLVCLIAVIGIWLRVVNQSSFTIYPDSYQSLIGAKNIAEYHNVAGYLGKDGMSYPPFFIWTHPGYPLVILFMTTFTHNLTSAAQLVALLSSVLAIPLTYFYLKSVLNSEAGGVGGMLLLALSFNHTVWSGFIMTEPLGVLCLILVLWSFFSALKTPPQLANPRDLLTGVLLGGAILVRYEYALILFPILFFLLFYTKSPLSRFITIISACSLVLALVISQLFSLQASLGAFTTQLPALFSRILHLLVPLGGVTLFLPFIPPALRKKLSQLTTSGILIFLGMGTVLIIAQLIFGFPLFYHDLTFIRNFFLKDFFLGIFSLLGLIFLLKEEDLKKYAYFVLLSCLLLGALYLRVNPEMDRYMTHLIPFLLLPASFALTKIILFIHASFIQGRKVRSSIFIALLIVIILTQGVVATAGMHYWQDQSWRRVAYQDKAAEMVKTYAKDPSELLIVSLPEAYYYSTNLSTQSIADTYPYVFLDKSLDNKKALLVIDMGMRDIFPKFSQIALSSFRDKQISSFKVGERYHFENRSEQEKYPVILFAMTVKELKNRIRTVSSLQK